MTPMHAAALVLLTALSAGELKAQSAGKPSAAEIELIQAAMTKHGVPGASVAVIDGHKLLWTAGFGVQKQGSGNKVDENTVFQAASVSKPTTAMAVMVLAERKALKLDEDVNATLRAWKLPNTALRDGEPVTLRRLLSHSAGISVHGFGGYAISERTPSLLQVLRGKAPANSAPVVIEKKPGEAFQYSGGGYCIVQELLEELGKRPFAEIMDNLVLKPCEMTHSSFAQPLKGPLSKNMAAGHEKSGTPIPGDFHIYPEQAAAGLWTTAEDYARLLLAIDRAVANAPPQVFSQAMMKQMMTVQKEPYGLGWSLGSNNGDPTISHGGVNEGFRSSVWLNPAKGKGLAIFANSDKGSDFINEVTAPLLSGSLEQ